MTGAAEPRPCARTWCGAPIAAADSRRLAPSDDKREECHGLAMHAVLTHHPTPGRAAAQPLNCGTWALGFHAGERGAIRVETNAAR
jgi:hypothetical protein